MSNDTGETPISNTIGNLVLTKLAPTEKKRTEATRAVAAAEEELAAADAECRAKEEALAQARAIRQQARQQFDAATNNCHAAQAEFDNVMQQITNATQQISVSRPAVSPGVSTASVASSQNPNVNISTKDSGMPQHVVTYLNSKAIHTMGELAAAHDRQFDRAGGDIKGHIDTALKKYGFSPKFETQAATAS